MQATITQLHSSDKDKTGKAYIGKTGRTYTRLGLKTREHGDKWLSGFQNQTNTNWKIGDVVEIEVEEVAGKDGKQYLNFRMEGQEDKIWKMMTYLQSQINELKKGMADVRRNFGEVPDDEVGKINEELNEVKEADLPF